MRKNTTKRDAIILAICAILMAIALAIDANMGTKECESNGYKYDQATGKCVEQR